MFLRFILLSLALFLIGKTVNAQQQKVIVDISSNEPIEYVNVLFFKQKKGVITNQKGIIVFTDSNIRSDDTIIISHVSFEPLFFLYKDFQSLDTIRMKPRLASLNEVLISPTIDLSDFNNETNIGYFQQKDDGAFYMRAGEQLGLKIENKRKMRGLLKEVKLHFYKLVPNASFRLRIKKINEDGTIGDELIPNGVVIIPKKLKPVISLIEYGIMLPKSGIFVVIDYLGDGSNYSNRILAPPIKYTCTTRYSEQNTYTNYMDAYKWNHWKTILRNEKNPPNVQIQIKVLHK